MCTSLTESLWPIKLEINRCLHPIFTGSEINYLLNVFNVGQTRPLFCFIFVFSQNNDKYSTKFDSKSVDGVVGIRTQEHRMVGAVNSTELWRPILLAQTH